MLCPEWWLIYVFQQSYWVITEWKSTNDNIGHINVEVEDTTSITIRKVESEFNSYFSPYSPWLTQHKCEQTSGRTSGSDLLTFLISSSGKNCDFRTLCFIEQCPKKSTIYNATKYVRISLTDLQYLMV